MDDGLSWLALLSKSERKLRSEYILELYNNGGQYNVCQNCKHHIEHDVSGCTTGFVIGHMCEFSSRFYKFEKKEIIVDGLSDDSLGPAKGIIRAIILSLIAWGLIIWAAEKLMEG